MFLCVYKYIYIDTRIQHMCIYAHVKFQYSGFKKTVQSELFLEAVTAADVSGLGLLGNPEVMPQETIVGCS